MSNIDLRMKLGASSRDGIRGLTYGVSILLERLLVSVQDADIASV
jgi:hypothetical protein